MALLKSVQASPVRYRGPDGEEVFIDTPGNTFFVYRQKEGKMRKKIAGIKPSPVREKVESSLVAYALKKGWQRI